jgi:hypothetical protein
MLFSDCLRAIRVLPNKDRAVAEMDLRALRVWRLEMWAPAKRGKSTLIRGTAAALTAPMRMLSIDSDQVDSANIERVPLPGFNDQKTWGEFVDRFEAALGPCADDLASGKIAGVALDTLTTIQYELESLGDKKKMLTESQMESQQRRGKQARVLISMAASITGLHARALQSPLDGAIVLCFTQHARKLSNGTTFAFEGWCPRIGSNTGEATSALADAMIAVGLEPPHCQDPLRFAIVWNGRADVGVRLGDDEREVWERCMSMKADGFADPKRLGKAMAKIWEMRKARWVLHRIGPHVHVDGEITAESVLAAALADPKVAGASKPAEQSEAPAADVSNATAENGAAATEPAATTGRRRR